MDKIKIKLADVSLVKLIGLSSEAILAQDQQKAIAIADVILEVKNLIHIFEKGEKWIS